MLLLSGDADPRPHGLQLYRSYCEVNILTCRAVVEFDGLGVSAIVLHEGWVGRWRAAQIEVAFEIGYKETGMSGKITITCDQGCLAEVQIVNIFLWAEQFIDEDKKVKERVYARNAFGGF